MTTQVTLPPLHPSQEAIARSRARFRVVCCGRRWGKTMLGIHEVLKGALAVGGRYFWVAPSYKQALEGWDYLIRLVYQMPKGMAVVNATELVARFLGGGSVQVRTASDPDSLRGPGLDGVVLDEAAIMKPDTWELVLRPALADRQGWAMFISTPRHFNWFFDLYQRGEAGEPNWASWQHPTWDNPYIPEEELLEAQRNMLPEDYDQEFGASFTAIGGAVFRLLSQERGFYLRVRPRSGLEFQRLGVGMDWGTTQQHKAAVVSGGLLTTGAVWQMSAWEDYTGSSDRWRNEAIRCKQDYGASFARVDRSQSSEVDRLKAAGFQADTGVANVDSRIGNLQALVIARAVFWDAEGPGMVAHYNRLCAYHRDREGKIVEEDDDSVDANLYLVAELARPAAQYVEPTARPLYKTDPRPVAYPGRSARQAGVRGGAI